MTFPYEYARAAATSRAESQDAVGLFEREDALVVALADGGGGMRGGEAASRSLVSIVGSAALDPAFAVDDIRSWIDLFQATDAGLAVKGAGETTGVVVALGRDRFVGLSIGNSEAWVVTENGVDNLTVGQHTRLRLGGSRAVMSIFERQWLSGVLVAATDGLFKYASVEVIARVVRVTPLADAAERLVELVRLRSGKLVDDVAVVLVRQIHPSGGLS